MKKTKLNLIALNAIIIFTIMLVTSFDLSAQSITGQVTDTEGEELIGVSVLVKGKSTGYSHRPRR